MKIYEIVSTNEELNESFKSKVLGGALDSMMKLIGKGSTKNGLEEIARFINHEGKLDIELIRNTRKWGPKFADELEKNPKLVKKIENLHANKLKDIQYSKNITDLKKITSNIKETSSTMLEWIKAASILYIGFNGLYEPIATYRDNIEIAEQYLDSGKVSADQFNTYRRKEAGALVGKLTTNVIALGAAKVPGALAKSILQRLSKLLGLKGNIGVLGTVIDGMTVVTSIAALKWINNEQNATIIANQLAKPIIGDIAAVDVAGAGITTIIDAFKNIASSGASAQSQSTMNTSPSTDSATAQSTTTDATTSPQGQPAATPYNPDDWEYYTPSLVKNKKTGEINFKPLN